MLTEMTDTSGYEAVSRREWHKAGADFWLRLAAAPTFAIMGAAYGFLEAARRICS